MRSLASALGAAIRPKIAAFARAEPAMYAAPCRPPNNFSGGVQSRNAVAIDMAYPHVLSAWAPRFGLGDYEAHAKSPRGAIETGA